MKQKRKTATQIRILTAIFSSDSVEVTNELRKESCKKTGLKWVQIYKWLFDRRTKAQSSNCPENEGNYSS